MDRQEQEKQEEREDMATIRMKRGIQSDIETMPLLSGEMAVALDTGRVFVGTEEGNIPMMGDGGDMDTSIYDPQKKQQDIFAYIDQKRSTRTARFVVGTATAGWTKDDCDYLCDGTDDQEEIMAAIAALPASGGEILILDGTYHITASIQIRKDNIAIRGNGYSTILQTCFSTDYPWHGAIHCTANHCAFTYFAMDGNKENYEDSSCFTSDLISGGTLPEYILLDHLYIHDAGVYGMEIYMNKAIVTNCDLLRCKWGVLCQGGSNGQKDVIVSNNQIIGMAGEDDDNVNTASCSGIHMTAEQCLASNNIVQNCSWGAYIMYKRCICTDNVFQNNLCGITIAGSKAGDCIVVGNICGRDNKNYDGYEFGTIRIGEGVTNSVIMGNRCLGKAPTVTGATGNLIENNLTS